MKLNYKALLRKKRQVLRRTKEWYQDRNFNPEYMVHYMTPEAAGITAVGREEILSVVSQLEISDALKKLAHWNVTLSKHKGCHDGFRKYLLNEFFDPMTAARIQRVSNQGVYRQECLTPFHFRVLLSLLIHNSHLGNSNSISDPLQRQEVGAALLCIPSVYENSIEVAENDPTRLLFFELENRRFGYQNDSRLDEIMSIKGYLMEKLLKIDGVREAITDTFGFDPDDVQIALVMIWSFFHQNTWETLPPDACTSLDLEYMLVQIEVGKAVGAHIVSNYCINVDETPYERNDIRMDFDISLLADRPLAYYRGSIICLDLDLLFAKVARELWNIARKATDLAKISEFQAKSGYFFESYCERYLRHIESVKKDDGAKLLCSDELGKAALDFLYIEGDVAVAIECKTAVIPTQIAYGEDPKELAKALQSKFVSGVPKDKQGFKQIADHLEIVLDNPLSFGIENVRCIIPCLIVVEPSLTTFACYDYVVTESVKLFGKYGNKVMSPVIIHSEDLMVISACSKSCSFFSILSELTTENVQAVLTTKAYLYKRLKEHMKEADRFMRPQHYLEAALARLEKVHDKLPSKPCPICKYTMRSLEYDDGTHSWWCQNCKSSFSKLTPFELDRMRATRDEVIKKYEES